MPGVECPECGQISLIPLSSTRSPSDQELCDAPITAAAETMEIDVVEMSLKPRKRPPPLPKLHDDLDLGNHNDLDLNKRRKLQDSLGYFLLSLIFAAVVISIVVCSGGDPTGFTAVCFGMLTMACYYIAKCLYLLATTPRSITKAAFCDRNYWYSYFFIADKAPEDYGCGDESADGAKDRPRDGEILLASVLAFSTLYFSAFVLAPKVVLIGHYGWTKVQQEHLHIVAMRGTRPWPVSNGDLLEISFAHFIVTGICWFGSFFPLFAILRLMLPKRKKPK
jgi:hypothetical protein